MVNGKELEIYTNRSNTIYEKNDSIETKMNKIINMSLNVHHNDMDIILSILDNIEMRIDEIKDRIRLDKKENNSMKQIMTRINYNDVGKIQRRLEIAKTLYEKIMIERKTREFYFKGYGGSSRYNIR
jgi:hypothetical protein